LGAVRLTAIRVISDLGVAVGTFGRRSGTAGCGLEAGVAARGRAGLAMALRFAGAAAFFLAGFATLRRAVAAVRFLRAAMDARAFLRTGFALFFAALDLARARPRAFFPALDLRPLVFLFAATVNPPS
jgi:cation transport ATPase